MSDQPTGEGSADVRELPVEDLAPEARDALRREILFLADSKRILGIRYSDWLLGAPSVETAIAASSMAQDEWGHARLIYAMLKDWNLDPVEIEHQRSAGEYCCVPCLDDPFESWADVIAAVVVVDGALTVVMEGLAQGRYEQARSRIPKMLAEEEFHRDMGVAWFRRIAQGTPAGREALAEATRRFLAHTLACLDPGDDAAATLAAAGVTRPGPESTARFAKGVGGVVEMVGVSLDRVDPARDGWDEERRRGPGQPGGEAVERARGDLNRALFVE